MSSRTSSRSTLTIVPSTMSPSLKYLIVSSIAAMKSSADPMSLTATCGLFAGDNPAPRPAAVREGTVSGRTSVTLVIGGWAPAGVGRRERGRPGAPADEDGRTRRTGRYGGGRAHDGAWT